MQDALAVTQTWIRDAFTHEWVWRLAVSLAIVVVGVWLSRWLSRILDRLMLRFRVEDILRNFLRNVAYAITLVVVLIAALDYAGVPTTSLLAVIGAAGLAIGLALKDSLSNIASGVMLIVLRPFHTGDQVQVAGLEGVVDSVRIFQTRIHTADNREIILPNSEITAAAIINYTGRGERRIDLPLLMPYTEDLAGLREILLGIATSHPRVKESPAPEVVAMSLGDANVSLQLRVWVAARDHAAVQSDLLESVLVDSLRRGRGAATRREVHVYHHGIDPDAAPAMDQILKPSL